MRCQSCGEHDSRIDYQQPLCEACTAAQDWKSDPWYANPPKNRRCAKCNRLLDDHVIVGVEAPQCRSWNDTVPA